MEKSIASADEYNQSEPEFKPDEVAILKQELARLKQIRKEQQKDFVHHGHDLYDESSSLSLSVSNKSTGAHQ